PAASDAASAIPRDAATIRRRTTFILASACDATLSSDGTPGPTTSPSRALDPMRRSSPPGLRGMLLVPRAPAALSAAFRGEKRTPSASPARLASSSLAAAGEEILDEAGVVVAGGEAGVRQDAPVERQRRPDAVDRELVEAARQGGERLAAVG